MEPKNARTDAIVFALCVVCLISIFVSVIFNAYIISKKSTGADGTSAIFVLDVDSFRNEGKCIISERWEYYNGVHLVSEDIEDAELSGYVELPMRWSMFNRDTWGRNGKASYKIILTNLPGEDLVFCLYGISPAIHVFVNGHLQDASSYRRSLYQINLPNRNTSEIVVEVSSNWLTGVYACPWLYNAALFQREMNTANSIWMASLGAFLAAFLLCTVLLLRSKAKKQYHMFSFSFICIALFYMFTGNEMTRQFHYLYEYVSFEQIHLFVTALAVVLGYVTVRLQCTLFPDFYEKKLSYFISGMLFASIFLRLLLDVYMDMDIITICLLVMFLVYEIICTFLAIRTSRQELVPVAAATIMIIVAISVATLASAKHFFYGVYVIMPCSLLLAILFYANFWALRFAKISEAAANEHMAKQKQLDAEIAYLTSQIQPHFQYNTLTMIQELCYIDAEKAAEAIVLYSSLLRRKVDFNRYSKLIPFSDELDGIMDYVTLQKLRFKDAIHFDFQIETTDFEIPPLAIQTLIENAVHHGLRKKPEGGKLTLEVKKEKKDITIRVIDNGVGFNPEIRQRDHVGSGLDNSRFRIETLLNGTFVLKSAPGSGTCVTVLLPYQMKKRKKGGNNS